MNEFHFDKRERTTTKPPRARAPHPVDRRPLTLALGGGGARGGRSPRAGVRGPLPAWAPESITTHPVRISTYLTLRPLTPADTSRQPRSGCLWVMRVADVVCLMTVGEGSFLSGSLRGKLTCRVEGLWRNLWFRLGSMGVCFVSEV